MTKSVRSWVAVCQWSGRERFHVGTFHIDGAATFHETLDAARDQCRKWLTDILPEGTTPPEIVDMIPGALIFIPEER